MAANVAFDNSGGTPATPWNDVEKDVVNVFFGAGSRWNWEHRKLVSYFEYYRAEIDGLSAKMGEYNRQSFELPAKHHMDFLKVVKELQEDFSLTRAQLRTKVTALLPQVPHSGAEPKTDRCIDIAVRLWLMLNTREWRFANDGKGQMRECPDWTDTQRFQDFVHGLFPKSTEKLSLKESRLKPGFTVAYMVNVCGLNVEWTYSLEDHLRLDRQRNARTLWVFAEEAFLKAHEPISCFDSVNQKITPPSGPPIPQTLSSGQHVARSPYPKDLLAETIRTYGLLFPSTDTETTALLHTMKKAQFSPQSPILSLRKFPYWQERLLELYEEVYLAPPVGLKQMWRDRRDPEKFSNFVIATMVAILTIVSTVTGIIQSVTAVLGAVSDKNDNRTSS